MLPRQAAHRYTQECHTCALPDDADAAQKAALNGYRPAVRGRRLRIVRRLECELGTAGSTCGSTSMRQTRASASYEGRAWSVHRAPSHHRTKAELWLSGYQPGAGIGTAAGGIGAAWRVGVCAGGGGSGTLPVRMPRMRLKARYCWKVNMIAWGLRALAAMRLPRPVDVSPRGSLAVAKWTWPLRVRLGARKSTATMSRQAISEVWLPLSLPARVRSTWTPPWCMVTVAK